MKNELEKYSGYSIEEQERKDVSGIEFEQIPHHKPFRDPFRMESFMDRFESALMKYWNQHPDDRFGQILTIFQYFIANRGKKDFFYMEDEEFMKLWEEFIEEKVNNSGEKHD